MILDIVRSPTPAPTPDPRDPCDKFVVCDQCVIDSFHPGRSCSFCNGKKNVFLCLFYFHFNQKCLYLNDKVCVSMIRRRAVAVSFAPMLRVRHQRRRRHQRRHQRRYLRRCPPLRLRYVLCYQKRFNLFILCVFFSRNRRRNQQ